MSDYSISKIYASDKTGNKEVEALLHKEGIRRDPHLDYTCGMYDGNGRIIATGSCFGGTLRCMAVSSEHQGEGLMNEIVTHLIEYQFARRVTHLFLYTKCSSARFFGDLGFHEIARIEGQIVFMENKRTGFRDYLRRLSSNLPEVENAAAIVMNANPFTLGHQYLVERACAENDVVHLFIISEDASLVPFEVRRRLVREGTAHLPNILYHETGPYIISSATFPSYFQKDDNAVIESHALLDLTVFTKIAQAMHIGRRYVGEEPRSVVTGIYNDIMREKLPENGIECIVVPRKETDGEIISASTVRQALKDGDMDILRTLVPETTLSYFESEEAAPVIAKIRREQDVRHY